MTNETLLTISDILVRCNLSKSFLYVLLKKGAFPEPAIRIGSKFTRWRSSDVDGWLRDPQNWTSQKTQTKD